MQDSFDSIARSSTGLFTDRGSKFYAFAYPVSTEQEIKHYQEALRKEHFKARHHCYAWRLGQDNQVFRANDDGEPSGTAGRPILGQIDTQKITNVLVVVVRYFGGTLLGTSGLINAYREAASLALATAERVTHYITDIYQFRMSYALLPSFTVLARSTSAHIKEETYTGNDCTITLEVRSSQIADILDKIKAGLHGLPASEAADLAWPDDITVEKV